MSDPEPSRLGQNSIRARFAAVWSYFREAHNRRLLWWALGVIAFSLAILAVLQFFFGEMVEANFDNWLAYARRENLGLPVSIGVFMFAAMIGFPQFGAIVACVLAFGPLSGFWYSVVGTVIAGVVTFGLGKGLGLAFLNRFIDAENGKVARAIGDNAFRASFFVRLVPTGPFIVINMVMGATGMRTMPFFMGLTLGSIPKTAVVTVVSSGLWTVVQGNTDPYLIGGVVIACVVALVGGVWLYSSRSRLKGPQ